MAAVDEGTVHVYGITGTVTNAKVQSVTLKESFANQGTTENETGVVVERRLDDRTTNATFVLKFTSTYTKPAIGDTFTFNSIPYLITDITKEEKNKDFQMYTIEAITSESVSLS